MVDLVKGAVHPVTDPKDVEYFRAKPDVLVECNAKGEVFGAAAPGAVDPKKAKSFRTYGNKPPQPGQGPMPPPPTVAVGKPVVGTTLPPGLPPLPQQVAKMDSGALKQPAGLPPLPPPPPENRKARSDKARSVVAELEAQSKAEPMSPIEEVGTDGKTQAQIPTRR